MVVDLSSFSKILQDKPVAVFGLGVSNMAAIKSLRAAGVEVIAFDDCADRRAEIEALGAQFTPLTAALLSSKKCTFLLLAPGVPLHYPKPHAVVSAARSVGLEIICDVELFHRLGLNHGRKTIGITGTNGKSTTTALLTHVLSQCGIEAVMGGNIGRPVFDLDVPASRSGVFVFELSSFQLDLCPTFFPDIAALLNITPDHLDRHGTMAGYSAAKARIFEGQGRAMIGVDDEYSRAIYERLQVESARGLSPVSVSEKEGFPDFSAMKLKGDHNWQNAAFVYLIAQELGLDSKDIIAALNSFSGLAHRQCLVRQIGDVSYVNDSKATNAMAAATALSAFEDIYWILGGRAKEGGLDNAGLEALAPRIAQAFLIGEAQEEFAHWMSAHDIAYTKCETLERAVSEAHEQAHQKTYQDQGAQHKGEAGERTVLLSPACASFDQFKNFEERGEIFAALVENLRA